MLQVSDLLAREAIRDLVIRCNSYGDSGLLDRTLGFFAPEAVVEIRGEVYQGLHAIRQAFSEVPARTSKPGGRPAYLRHRTATHQIDLVDETKATGRCYFSVLTAVGLDLKQAHPPEIWSKIESIAAEDYTSGDSMRPRRP